ncbi:MAG: DUF5063 domain-containing protein [Terriglobales bacterium]
MVRPNDIESAFREFSLVASQFCTVVDSTPRLERVQLLSRIYEVLPRLIHQGIVLPVVSPTAVDDLEEIKRSRVKQEEWGQLYESLKEKLGDWNLYWQVFDPTKDSEAVHGSLADDIADIYRDIKEGLRLRDPDLPLQRDAVWGWRFGYYSHWGQHAINALYTAHALLESTLS